MDSRVVSEEGGAEGLQALGKQGEQGGRQGVHLRGWMEE